MKIISTPDLCDEYEGQLRILAPIFTNYGGHHSFSGAIVTIKCFEDNSVLKQLVDTPGQGRVIVMDGGGSLRKAILGDMLALKAANNGWSGILINGCIRDAAQISEMDVGVFSIGTCPRKSIKKGEGDINVPVAFSGVLFKPGHFLYADEDGIVVCERALSIPSNVTNIR